MTNSEEALPKIAPALEQSVRSRPIAPMHRCYAVAAALLAQPAHASLFQGDTLDAVANAIAWIALIVGPLVAIAVFWLVHILPEKIAEKRNHPQAKAIHTLCLLSLFFGGMLWPIAWLWAYTKPVLYKMAYGTDVGEHEPTGADVTPEHDAAEAQRLRMKVVAEREAAVPAASPTRGLA